MSALLEHWRAGQGLPDTLVLDGHIHIGEWPHGATFASVDDTVSGAVRYLDANGVDACCVLSGGYMWNGTDHTIGNDILLDVWRRLPDRIVPYLHVNPNDSAAAVDRELERMYAAGCRCIKLLNAYQNYPGDGPNLMRLYRFAAERRMLVMNHWWAVDVLGRIAREFPQVEFVTAHYGADQNPLLKERPNVHANIWTLDSLGFLERGIREVGAHKFLLGSDAFMNPMSVGIGLVVYADIPDDEKRLILGLNQARLLDKVGALPGRIKRQWLL